MTSSNSKRLKTPKNVVFTKIMHLGNATGEYASKIYEQNKKQ
jgi:hypothetical protein